MYKKLYNEDAYIKEFDSNVVSVGKKVYKNEEIYEFVLEETCFFPEQGGQTSDTGKLTDTETGKIYEVFRCEIKDDTVYHLTKLIPSEKLETSKSEEKNNDASDSSIPRKVHGVINWEERFDKMQNHSGEHLVSGTVHRLFGYDNVGFALSAGNCTLDFNGTFEDADIDLIETTVNRAVFENIEVIVSYPSPEELRTVEYRSKKELTGEVRIVEFPGYDVCACCAPHVKHTGEIGLVKIISAEHFKGGTRITIRCGYRALNDYRTKLASCKNISKQLSVPVDEISQGVEKLNGDYQKTRFELNGKMNLILELKAGEVIKDSNPLIFIESADMNAARAVVNNMVKQNEGICGIFIGNDEKGYSYIISSSKINCSEILEKLKKEAGAKGGGNASMIQGNIPKNEETIRQFLL
ncbi:MAG: alanyl-tRNA editing protein [Lachnospiraceae bacterium]|nr:alanyl-tRNA editing protein [Lachnospiraceae bacterium]